jgi:hypothetical protein
MISVVKRVEFLVIDCDIVLRGCLGVVFLNLSAPTEDTLDYSQGGFCKDLYQVCFQFRKYRNIF